MPKPPPESTKISLRQRLTQHAQTRWPALAAVSVRYNDPTGWSLPPTD